MPWRLLIRHSKNTKLNEKDFVKVDAEWELIPVDRADPKLKLATQALEKTIEEVEQDNGYNATIPEEKGYVVDSLKDATEKLKKGDSISFAYLQRTAINSLDILIRRFGKASIGLTGPSGTSCNI